MSNGFMSNSELIDSVIFDLNNVLKEQLNGQYIQACCYVTKISQKLLNLRNTIDNDLKNREETIEKLKEQLRRCGCNIIDMTAQEIANERNVQAAVHEITEKDGANNG